MNSDILHSELFDESTFYPTFLEDLAKCKKEVYIESPFLTSNRLKLFYPIFKVLLARKVKIYIVTKVPRDLENTSLRNQAEAEIRNFEILGIQPLLCLKNHHRKLAILDHKILWEGSLNILSQSYSREIMRRMESEVLVLQMFEFLKLERVL